MVVAEALVYHRMMRKALLLTTLVGLIFLRCAQRGLIPLEKGLAEDREIRHYISDVPFFPQTKYQCGPAALASVLNYYGCRLTPGEIAKAIYEKRLKGTLSIDLTLFARRMGFNARALKGSISDLKGHISRDRPLIVFQDLGTPLFPIRHFSVVIGYDDAKGILVLHSGRRRDTVISYERFLKSWAEMDYWTLLILPAGVDGDRFDTPTSSKSSFT
ncbi:MAG: PA2778 family cysteine peptidase [Syntrophobacterales bacterium]|nr:MAG: PA2778 family cysteine peptidase [Syntrophobacterales bacterium]